MKSFSLSLSITLVFAIFLGVPYTSRAQTPTNHRVSETSRLRAAEPGLIPFGKSHELANSIEPSFTSVLRKAQAGDVAAMLTVAAKYKWGNGVTADRAKSHVWVRRAEAKFAQLPELPFGSSLCTGQRESMRFMIRFPMVIESAILASNAGEGLPSESMSLRAVSASGPRKHTRISGRNSIRVFDPHSAQISNSLGRFRST
jgi:hypothetical protein